MASLALAILQFGGASGCGGGSAGGGGGTTPTTRALSGSVSAASLTALRLAGAKSQALACADVTVCCASYSGGLVTKSVDASCNFSLDLPLNNFCYCGLFTGADADGNGCPDQEVGSLGCAENGYSGAIPIFPDANDGTDAIDLGTGDLEGQKLVVNATGNPCAQVDQDNDGTADSGDSDDDGDGTADSDDDTNSIGCENLDEFDSDSDGTPDIYEESFSSEFAALKLKGQTDGAAGSFFADTDNDNVPDGCDADFGCEPDEFDTDGDCIPDDFDFCNEDADSDGVGICVDCDDSDATVTTECYENCGDSDGDGVDDCIDCDPSDPAVALECGPTACTSDQQCKDAVLSSTGSNKDKEAIVTTCNTGTGNCEVNCADPSLDPDGGACESDCTSNGGSFDVATSICSFHF